MKIKVKKYNIIDIKFCFDDYYYYFDTANNIRIVLEKSDYEKYYILHQSFKDYLTINSIKFMYDSHLESYVKMNYIINEEKDIILEMIFNHLRN